MATTPSRPSNGAIVLAALSVTNRKWLVADEIRGRLKLFGFEGIRTQQVAAWLGRMSREDMPLFERRQQFDRDLEYSVTRYGMTLAKNTLPGLRVGSSPTPNARAAYDRHIEQATRAAEGYQP